MIILQIPSGLRLFWAIDGMGRRRGLKILWLYCRVGSSPTSPTIWRYNPNLVRE